MPPAPNAPPCPWPAMRPAAPVPEDLGEPRPRVAAVHEERQAQLLRELHLGGKPALLGGGRREVAVEVQPRLADRHAPRVSRQLAQRAQRGLAAVLRAPSRQPGKGSLPPVRLEARLGEGHQPAFSSLLSACANYLGVVRVNACCEVQAVPPTRCRVAQLRRRRRRAHARAGDDAGCHARPLRPLQNRRSILRRQRQPRSSPMPCAAPSITPHSPQHAARLFE